MFARLFALSMTFCTLAAGAETQLTRINPMAPNDTYFTSQWNLHNKGPGATPMGKGIVSGSDHAHIAEAWGLLHELGLVKSVQDIGKNIRLAVIDDGFDLKHEDLSEKFVAWKNFGDPVLNDNLFSMGPKNFHGTLVTGLAAAIGDNGKGIVGACPGCRLVAARMAADKPSDQTAEEYYQKIFDWVLTQNADVINCSWGPDPTTTPGFAQQLFDRLAREGRGGKGTVVVFASGNSGQDMAWNVFASTPQAIVVAASDSTGKRHGFSNYGSGLDLVAPTSGAVGSSNRYTDPIWTTDNYLAPECLKPGAKPSSGCADKAGWTPNSNVAGGDGWEGKYSYRFSHTSSAAPIVSGVVALMLQANPELSANEVQFILQHSADRVAAADARYDAKGFSNHYGYGRVNALRAVALAYEMSGRDLDATMKTRIDLTSPCTRSNCWALPAASGI
jgi:subtilisin family serine protease